jgi:hypothetical protein
MAVTPLTTDRPKTQDREGRRTGGDDESQPADRSEDMNTAVPAAARPANAHLQNVCAAMLDATRN